ncbi:unnamed protein product [Darwinula stevensoni]|uniref:Uncharacterized protein n=1 Tax=Darwinula stevensoni TaxID=69355 RepID=A0A7R9AEA4_9CRUS|nr:unnamed protein product [Darwinula stevensoni]CAG0901901.1 unnamed protein product [Darwinula stevensoni]
MLKCEKEEWVRGRYPQQGCPEMALVPRLHGLLEGWSPLQFEPPWRKERWLQGEGQNEPIGRYPQQGCPEMALVPRLHGLLEGWSPLQFEPPWRKERWLQGEGQNEPIG